MLVYTAGPISGLSYKQVVNRYKDQVKRLKTIGYESITPLAAKDYLRDELEFKANGYGNPVSTNKAIKGRDRWMVGQADIILADFTDSGERVSIGTCMELAWADDLKKHTVAVIPEGNIHHHAFVLECCNVIFNTIEDAYKYLEDLNLGIERL